MVTSREIRTSVSLTFNICIELTTNIVSVFGKLLNVCQKQTSFATNSFNAETRFLYTQVRNHIKIY